MFSAYGEGGDEDHRSDRRVRGNVTNILTEYIGRRRRLHLITGMNLAMIPGGPAVGLVHGYGDVGGQTLPVRPGRGETRKLSDGRKRAREEEI